MPKLGELYVVDKGCVEGGRGVCGRGVECWKMWKGFLVCALFWALARLTFVPKIYVVPHANRASQKASHTHTHTHIHMCIYRYILPLPFTTFWPSLIDCLTRGPANNLQFLLQSQSASCLFLFLSLSPSFSLPPFTYYAFLSLSF